MSGPSRPSLKRTGTDSSQTSKTGSSRAATSNPENYACPFAKHDPILYSHFNPDSDQEYRSCSTGLMRNISRLKQHLQRTHKDDMTEEQQRLVMERISGDHAQGWYNIYRILFPEDTLPATPYAEYVTGKHVRDLVDFIARHLPTILYHAACAEQFPGRTPPALSFQTPFATSVEQIYRALGECRREFGQQQGLSHVFAKGPPAIDLNATPRTASRTRSRPSQDPQMAQSMGSFTAGNSPDEEMSGMSSSEEFDEQLALRTIEDHNVHSVQGRSNPNYSPVTSPVYSPYTIFETQSQMAYDSSHLSTPKRHGPSSNIRRTSGR